MSPSLKVGADASVDSDLLLHSDLHGSRESIAEPYLSLAAWYTPLSWLHGFLSIEPTGVFADYEDDPDEKRVGLELTEAFILLRGIATPHLSAKIGRQRFEDAREWIFDEELDALQLTYSFPSFALEVAASRLDLARRDLVRDGPRDPTTNLHARAVTSALPTLDLTAFVLYRHHRSGSGERPLFLGIEAAPSSNDGPLRYWLEFAHVRGQEGSTNIRGYGFDVGALYQTSWPLAPSASIGFAFGTGDGNESDSVDHGFRQTGFQDNEASLAGVANLRYYGELFDPELSNLAVLHVGAGLRPTGSTSVDLAYHSYRQAKAAAFLRDSALGVEPRGESRDLGNEIDLVAGLESRSGIEIKAATGVFLPGRAFAGGRSSILFRVEVEYTFRPPR